MSRVSFLTAVYLILESDGKIFTVRRANTKYMEGRLSLPAGHLEAGETPNQAMIREAKEEIGIDIREEDLVFVHTQFYTVHNVNDKDYINIYFKAKSYVGMPHNAEPEKASEAIWVPIDEKDVLRNVQQACIYANQGVRYSEFILQKGEQP